jgi:hypothetical protein
VESFAQDLRFSLRHVLRNRGFAAVVIVALALGIGATTATFCAPSESPVGVMEYHRTLPRGTGDGVMNSHRGATELLVLELPDEEAA